MSNAPSLFERLPTELLQRAQSAGIALGVQPRAAQTSDHRLLSFGVDGASPELGLLRGQVTELCVARSGGLGTQLALKACAAAQRQGQGFGSGERHWCAFIDPAASLYAPGAAAQGVDLDRLLVVRPPVAALGPVALRMARSKVFVLLVVDTSGVIGQSLGVDLGAWVRIVRQMNVALEGSLCSVLLITNEASRRPLALPVARRIDLARSKLDVLRYRIARDRFRQPEPWHSIQLPVPHFDEAVRRVG